MNQDAKDSRINPNAGRSKQETTDIEVKNFDIQKLSPQVEHFKTVFAESRERVDRALAAAKSITKVETVEDDKYAEQFLVKARVTYSEIQKNRLEATKILDIAKAWAMGPEKELEVEAKRIAALRDARAQRIKEEEEAKQKEIEMQKEIEIYRGKVKAHMQQNLELGVIGRLKALEDNIIKMFADATLATIDGIGPYLKGVKPKLQRELFDKFIRVPYDQNKMTEAAYEDLVAKAIVFFDYDKTNAEYSKVALDTIAGWVDRIPTKKAELQRIEKATGEQKKKLEDEAENRRKLEEHERNKAAQQQQQEISVRASAAAQETELHAEFNATKAAQEAIPQAGTRTKKAFRIAPEVEADPIQVASLIGKLIIHICVLPRNGGKLSIFQKTKSGEIKLDEDGLPVYCDGVQYWLDEIAKIDYATAKLIPGLADHSKVKTTARAAK